MISYNDFKLVSPSKTLDLSTVNLFPSRDLQIESGITHTSLHVFSELTVIPMSQDQRMHLPQYHQ